ncbi:MAG: glycosyltransferase family 2 protein [Gemmatimonadaceae bacterium]|nr:glycosyltransferase family 2 protein [Chitinophagaceae bacterium]
MLHFSIVIVAKDAAHKIGRLLKSVEGLSDDIIVCDSGSSDDTMSIAREFGASVYSIQWKGYGKSKNRAVSYAKHDWVLSLDSDEKIDSELYNTLSTWKPEDDNTVYQVLWKNFFGERWIKHSDWGSDWKNRLFNKKIANWDDSVAHEDIISNQKLSYKKLSGYLEHYSFQHPDEYISKMMNSARLTAYKYHKQNKKSTVMHLVFSPAVCFIKSYLLRGGFLDGGKGWLIARTSAYYTYMKYQLLWKLNRNQQVSGTATTSFPPVVHSIKMNRVS